MDEEARRWGVQIIYVRVQKIDAGAFIARVFLFASFLPVIVRDSTKLICNSPCVCV